MYEVPVRFPSQADSDWPSRRLSGSRLRNRSLLRDRPRRFRRYLLYLGLLVGFCILLAFAGCGTNTPTGRMTATIPANTTGVDSSGVEIAPSNTFGVTIS